MLAHLDEFEDLCPAERNPDRIPSGQDRPIRLDDVIAVRA